MAAKRWRVRARDFAAEQPTVLTRNPLPKCTAAPVAGGSAATWPQRRGGLRGFGEPLPLRARQPRLRVPRGALCKSAGSARRWNRRRRRPLRPRATGTATLVHRTRWGAAKGVRGTPSIHSPETTGRVSGCFLDTRPPPFLSDLARQWAQIAPASSDKEKQHRALVLWEAQFGDFANGAQTSSTSSSPRPSRSGASARAWCCCFPTATRARGPTTRARASSGTCRCAPRTT